MDHYEELGIPRSASPEEIRTAWKKLAFLLHPDRQPDQQSRTIAELQMRRANDIIAVLGDPVRRRNYDMELERQGFGGTRPGPPPEPLVLRQFRRPHVWAVTGVLLVALTACALLWISVEGTDHVSPGVVPDDKHELSSASRVPQSDPGRQPAKQRSTGHVPALQETPRVSASRRHNDSRKPAGELAPPQLRIVELPPSQTLPQDFGRASDPNLPLLFSMKSVPKPPAPSPSPARPALRGTWVYLKPAAQEQPNPHVYPPEYIQLWIREESDGRISGNYLARYKARDQAVSPNVQFEFHGQDAGDSVFRWADENGAEGTIELRIIQSNSLRVHWTTTRMGRVSSLLAGTAVLSRTDGS